MINKNVIEIIDKLMDPNVDKIVYNASEVFTAIAHGYYYIRPGAKMRKFFNKIMKIISKDCKRYFGKDCGADNDTLLDAETLGRTVADMFNIARSMFDAEYYDSQVARMIMHERYDESLLERYLYWLDEDELKLMFEGLLIFKRDLRIFISDVNFDKMTDELEERALIAIKDNPQYMKDYDKHVDYIDNNWDFCFEYLPRETIIDIICRYVDEDPVMLASMVKTFKYSDIRTTARLTRLVAYIEVIYEMDIFNPTMTDVDKVKLEDYDAKHSSVFYRNKSGNFMTVQV